MKSPILYLKSIILIFACASIIRPIYAQEASGRPETEVTCMAENPLDGSMWMGTSNNGLFRLGKNEVKLHFGSANGKLGSDSIIYLCFDARGKLWILGVNGSITGYNADEGFEVITTESKEFSKGIYLPKEDKILITSVTKSICFNTLTKTLEKESELPFKPINLKLSADSSFVWIFGEKEVAKYKNGGLSPEVDGMGGVSDSMSLEFETYTPHKGAWRWLLIVVAGIIVLAFLVFIILRKKNKDYSEGDYDASYRGSQESNEEWGSPAEDEIEISEIEDKKEANPESSSVTKSEEVSKDFTNHILILISEHYKEPDFDVDAIAAIIGMSRIHVNRKLKAEGSPSPSVLIKERRMEVAKILLLRGEIPMAQIASECGFRSASYFTTAFKDYTGLTPSDFVAQNRL